MKDQLPVAKQRLKDLAGQGLFRHAIPEKFGGYNNTFFDLLAAHKTMGHESIDSGLVLSFNAHLWGSIFPILTYGSPAQISEYLPKLLDGNYIGGHAITEPQAGSDLHALQLHVEQTSNGFILNGHKRYITNAPIAGLLTVYAVLDNRLTAFIVKHDDPGVFFQNGPNVIGCATAPMGDVLFEQCQIPLDRLLGKSGSGAMILQYALELERAFIFAGLIGIMDWQLQTVIEHSRIRKSNNTHLGSHQAISHKIADMKNRLDSIRLWLDECAKLKDAGKRISLVSAQTKLFSSEAFLQSSLDAAQIMGAQGLLENQKMGRLILDAQASRLFSGSSEIQRNIIASLLGTGEGFRNSE